MDSVRRCDTERGFRAEWEAVIFIPGLRRRASEAVVRRRRPHSERPRDVSSLATRRRLALTCLSSFIAQHSRRTDGRALEYAEPQYLCAGDQHRVACSHTDSRLKVDFQPVRDHKRVTAGTYHARNSGLWKWASFRQPALRSDARFIHEAVYAVTALKACLTRGCKRYDIIQTAVAITSK